MGMTGTKAKRTKKTAPSPRSGDSPDPRVSRVTTLFKHLADPITLKILALVNEASNVARIAAAGAQDESAVRDQLAVLHNDGLVSLRRQGKQDLYVLTARGRRVLEMVRWLVYVEQPADEEPVTTAIDPELLKDVGGLVDDPVGWFLTRNPEFEGRRPIELLGTPDEEWLRNRILAAKLGMFS